METRYRSILNNILQQEIIKLVMEIEKHKNRFGSYNWELELRGELIGKTINQIIQKSRQEIDKDTRSIIGNVRKYFRRFRRFNIHETKLKNELVYDEPHPTFMDIPYFQKFEDLESYLMGFEYAYDNLMGVTKKMLQGHELDHYWQNKKCIRLECKNKLNGEIVTLVNRGFVCQECEPIENLDE